MQNLYESITDRGFWVFRITVMSLELNTTQCNNIYQCAVIFVCLQEFSPPLAKNLILVLGFAMKAVRYLCISST
jgi:hypothetical protein